MDGNEPALSRAGKLALPSLMVLAAVCSLYLGITKSNQFFLIVGMVLVLLSASLFSLAVVPILRPTWSIVVGSYSGLIFSLPTLFLGGWALQLATRDNMPAVRIVGYLFLFLGVFSMIALIRLLTSQSRRFGWYREWIEGCRKAGEYDWCITAGKDAIAAMAGKPEFNDMKAGFHNQLGVTYFRQRAYQQAIREYTDAIGHHPVGRTVLGVPGYKLAIAYTNRAEAHIALGNYQAANADCEKALEVDPGDEYARDLKKEVENGLRGT